MTRYLIIIERTESGFSAYFPDVPGCVSTGSSVAELEANMSEAIAAHLAELREDGATVPEPTSVATYVEVAA
jgi:predicted RNase H-like HicB family nuclease